MFAQGAVFSKVRLFRKWSNGGVDFLKKQGTQERAVIRFRPVKDMSKAKMHWIRRMLLKDIARIHCASVIRATEAINAFDGSIGFGIGAISPVSTKIDT